MGGSGKQSLSRLASFISGYEVRQLQVTGSFKVDDLLEAFREMFKQSGVKGIPIVFLMTDTQVSCCSINTCRSIDHHMLWS